MSFLDFLGQYWPYILQGVEFLLGIVAFILFILNKKGKISSSIADEALAYIFRFLPILCTSSEQLSSDGKEKKEIVIRAALEILSNFFHRKLTDDEVSHYRPLIDSAIEDILSSPQKKEFRK